MTDELIVERLIGRFALVQGVVDCLLDPSGPGVLLLGDAGMGKTALMHQVLEELGGRVRPYQINAGPSLARVPYAALAPLLMELTPEQIDQPIAVFDALSVQFSPDRRTGAVPALLVVEDGQYLDENSVALVTQLMVAEVVRVVFLCRTFPAPPAELLTMWSEGLLERFEVLPLEPDEAVEMCQEVLGAPVVSSTVAVLLRQSSGNPMLLRELLLQGRQSGQLVQGNNSWILNAPVQAAGSGLMDIVRQQVLGLDESDRQTLETVALAESLPLDTLVTLCDNNSIDHLQELGFIHVAEDHKRHVRLVKPLVAEILRQLVPKARGMAIRHRILAALDGNPETMDGLLRFVLWSLETGAPVDEETILHAARLANRLYLPGQVEQLALAIHSAKYRCEAAVELARARYYSGDYRAANSALNYVIDEAQDPLTLRQASLLAAQLAASRGAGSAGVTLVARAWNVALQRLAAVGTLSAQKVAVEQDAARLLWLSASHADGRYGDVQSELAALWEHSELLENRIQAGLLLSESLALTGQASTALGILDSVATLLSTDVAEHHYYRPELIRIQLVALHQAGEYQVLEGYVGHRIVEAENSLLYMGSLLQFAVGAAELNRGALIQALPHLIQSVEMLRLRDVRGLLPEALATVAYAAHLVGRNDLAVSYLAQADAQPLVGRELSLVARARLISLQNEMSNARLPLSQLVLLADEAAAAGARSAELEVLYSAVRHGEASLVLRLASVAEKCEGRRAAFVLEFCRAIVVKDAVKLTDLSELAAREGQYLAAADCAAQAVKILDSRGDQARRFGAQRLYKRRIAALTTGGVLREPNSPDLGKLTRREQEIATLVQSGCSNREIALQLSVSLRTIEGHLYRIFAKLGISRRDDLAGRISVYL
ncbi:LuxR C-terminal-related transcriptional regulator [Pseudarthrobacter sp. J1763]|uniref:LuxR C-terminal-related transcriptional regulator n=1 Tax=Pseudarthrobacter sp. J1763 TaxID=3420445 RepID=UPI003D2A7C46